MENDFFIEMGYTGLTGRLKRLNDLFVSQTRHFYKEFKVDIEPNWHPVFMLLQKHQQLTIAEISENLHFSHPAVVKLINKMKTNGYIDSIPDPHDNRKNLLTLSLKAHDKLPQLQLYWKAGEDALKELMNGNVRLLDELRVLEKNMATLNFKERMKNYCKKN